MEYDPNYVLNLNGTMLEIHDRLSDIYDKLSNPKVEIPYKEEDYGYEDNVNGYIFHLAKDTYELKDVGHAMHICVGGYGDDAINKHCTIVICTKDDELKVCIELSGDMKKICQAKLHDNKYPMDEIRDVILKWIKKHDIQINTNDLDGIDRRIRYHNEDNAQLRHNVPLAIRQNVKSSIQNIDSTLENLYAEFAMNPNLPIFNKDVEQGTEYKEAI
jgi:hypothetical protein